MHRRSYSVVFKTLIFVTAISIASGLRTTINCNGTSLSKQFDSVFNIGILFNGNTVAQIEEKSKISVMTSGVTVNDVTGSLSQSDKYLMAVLDVQCGQTDDIHCEIFGLLQDKKIYKSEKFQPLITFEVKEANKSITKTPDKNHYTMGDVVTVQCFVNAGSNRSRWWFHVDCQGVYQSQYDVLESSITTISTMSNCVYRHGASVNVTVKEEGPVRVRCMKDRTEVASITLESDDIEGNLSFHLLLSSIFLVYCPFIIMPSLWCSCSDCSKKLRNPEKEKYKYLRSAISVGDGLAFMFWWIYVYVNYGEKPGFISYGTFAVLEGSFIFVYALYRCLFKFLEASDSWFGARQAFNARMTASHGAVTTPIICWLMIRFPKALPCSLYEIFFWIVAIPSLLFFGVVSHRREGKDWTKQD